MRLTTNLGAGRLSRSHAIFIVLTAIAVLGLSCGTGSNAGSSDSPQSHPQTGSDMPEPSAIEVGGIVLNDLNRDTQEFARNYRESENIKLGYSLGIDVGSQRVVLRLSPSVRATPEGQRFESAVSEFVHSWVTEADPMAAPDELFEVQAGEMSAPDA